MPPYRCMSRLFRWCGVRWTRTTGRKGNFFGTGSRTFPATKTCLRKEPTMQMPPRPPAGRPSAAAPVGAPRPRPQGGPPSGNRPPPGGPPQGGAAPWGPQDVDKYQPGLTPEQKQRWLQIANESRSSCLEGGGQPAQCDAMAVKVASEQVAPEKPTRAPGGAPGGAPQGAPGGMAPQAAPMGAAPKAAPMKRPAMGAPTPGRPPRAGM